MEIKILIACEESQTVTVEFRKLGFEAYSCDLQECSGGHPEWHIQDNVLNVINDNWSMMIAHPPCTYLANSGVTWLWNKDGTKNKERWKKLEESALLFKTLLNATIKHIAIENPIPHKYAIDRIGKKYDQIIQPYQFGHPESKATCFWLKGLPKLETTFDVKNEFLALPKNKAQRIHFFPPSKDRAKIRSKTFQGIAKAMSEQWGKLLT